MRFADIAAANNVTDFFNIPPLYILAWDFFEQVKLTKYEKRFRFACL